MHDINNAQHLDACHACYFSIWRGQTMKALDGRLVNVTPPNRKAVSAAPSGFTTPPSVAPGDTNLSNPSGLPRGSSPVASVPANAPTTLGRTSAKHKMRPGFGQPEPTNATARIHGEHDDLDAASKESNMKRAKSIFKNLVYGTGPDTREFLPTDIRPNELFRPDYPMFSGFEAPETSRTYGGDTPREDDLTTMGARLGRLAASGADSSGWYDRTDLNDTGDAETPDDPGFLRGDGDRWIGGEDVGQPRQPFDANDEAEPGNYEFHQGDRMSTDPATRVADSDYFPSAREAANRSIRGETGAFRRIGQSYVSTGIPDDLPNSDYRSARPRVAKRAHTGADTWLARRRTAKSASALGTGFFANVVTQAGTNGFTYIDTPETE